MKTHTLLIILAFLIMASGCIMIEQDPGPVYSDFQSPEELMENPYLSKAISESGIETYLGTNPPIIDGKYSADGAIIKHHPSIIGPFPAISSSNICFYNQSKTTIDFEESVDDINGVGSYLTGENGRFTIWGESSNSGTILGVPLDCNATVVVIISGRRLEDGDLQVKALVVSTELKNCEGFVGGWYIWEAGLTFIGICSSH